MEEFLIVALQALIEFIVEVLSWDLVDWWPEPARPANPVAEAFVVLVVGSALGAVSVWLWPHTFLRFAALRIGNFALAPVASGTLATWRKRHGARTWAHAFWPAFAFTLGLVAVRFAYATRPL